jgi:hypothetical protein
MAGKRKSRVEIKDLTVNEELTEDEKKKTKGGFSLSGGTTKISDLDTLSEDSCKTGPRKP